MDLSGFNANEVEPSHNGFELVPAGDYTAIIVSSEEKQTKSGNGSYLELEFEVVEGQFSSRRFWERLNLNNPSEKAVEIARGTLSSICRAVKITQPNDSSALHNIPLVLKIGHKRDKVTGEIENNIRGYEATGGAPAKPPTAGAAAVKPTWMK